MAADRPATSKIDKFKKWLGVLEQNNHWYGPGHIFFKAVYDVY